MSAASRDPLEIFRSLYCVTLAALVLVRLLWDFRFLRFRDKTRDLPRLFGRFALPRLAPTAGLAVGLALAFLLAVAGAGLAPAPVLFLACLGALCHFAQLADSPVVHRKANTVPVILALLAAAALPTTSDPAVVSTVTRIVIKLLIAQIFLSAALTKLRETGWRWTDGQTLRRWLAYYHLRDNNAAALQFAGSPRLCRAAATLTLGFELTFWLVIPLPALAWIYLPAALAFHVATACLLRIHYWLYLGPAYLVFAAEWIAAPS
jgi:hypothetical protein